MHSFLRVDMPRLEPTVYWPDGAVTVSRCTQEDGAVAGA